MSSSWIIGGVIRLHFLHYKTFNEGVSAWKRRMERVHWDNMYVVLVERDGCSYQDLKDFEKLPFEHKVALTKRMYPKLRNTFFMEDYVNCSEVGDIMRFNNFFGKRGDSFFRSKLIYILYLIDENYNNKRSVYCS